MKIIYNNFLPFRGFKCINLFGVLFVRKESKGKLTDVDLNHERIHTAQFNDLLYVFYYPVYIAVWLIEILRPPYGSAYRDTCFERESYANEADMSYLSGRKRFAFMKYWHR